MKVRHSTEQIIAKLRQADVELRTDLTPLDGMNLKFLAFTPRSIAKGIEVIRNMKNPSHPGTRYQEFIPAAEFRHRYDAGEFT